MFNKSRLGEPVSLAFKRLQRSMDLNPPRLVSAPSINRTITPQGTLVKLFKQDFWDHPFRVAANDSYFSVSAGTVNGIIPYIKSATGGEFLRLNGYNQKGEFDYETTSLPVGTMDMSKINDDGGLYILVRVKRNKTTGDFGTKIDEEKGTTTNPEDLQIVLEKEFEGPVAGENDEFGYHPLGFVQFSDDKLSVLTVLQVTHFNLRYSFQDRRATLAEIIDNPKRLTIGRHVFYQI